MVDVEVSIMDHHPNSGSKNSIDLSTTLVTFLLVQSRESLFHQQYPALDFSFQVFNEFPMIRSLL